jgi:pimeloyl-ACP methyl ester carboxylesterase
MRKMTERSGFLDIEDGRLHYQVAGAGDPIVLLHGFCLDARMWDGDVERFARDHTVVRYDLRGFGRSSLPVAPFTHTGDLRALLAHLEIDRAHVVGLSMGGGVALDFALTHPGAVRSLVLADTIVSGFKWQENGAIMGAAGEAAKSGGIEAGKKQWLANPLFAPALRTPDVAMRLGAMVRDYSGWHLVNDSPQRALQPPAWERLGDVAARTLVLVGRLDLADFRAIADRLVREIPGARGQVFDGVGHMVNMEAPVLFHDHVARFLAGSAVLP